MNAKYSKTHPPRGSTVAIVNQTVESIPTIHYNCYVTQHQCLFTNTYGVAGRRPGSWSGNFGGVRTLEGDRLMQGTEGASAHPARVETLSWQNQG